MPHEKAVKDFHTPWKCCKIFWYPPLIDSAPVLGIKNDQSLRIYRQSISGLPYAVTGARAIFIFYILKIFLKSLNDL